MCLCFDVIILHDCRLLRFVVCLLMLDIISPLQDIIWPLNATVSASLCHVPNVRYAQFSYARATCLWLLYPLRSSLSGFSVSVFINISEICSSWTADLFTIFLYTADSKSASPQYKRPIQTSVNPRNLAQPCCTIIPVQLFLINRSSQLTVFFLSVAMLCSSILLNSVHLDIHL